MMLSMPSCARTNVVINEGCTSYKIIHVDDGSTRQLREYAKRIREVRKEVAIAFPEPAEKLENLAEEIGDANFTKRWTRSEKEQVVAHNRTWKDQCNPKEPEKKGWWIF